ncbi:DNA-3-methyladenine glycosylase 1 [Phtheirospermum japonicum]|uniref:DNA-3-methyladenine glycosylase 1 n=1 Tax=Phtheirospermum japonicum TaxID=374723 RepID=A0A830D624_9LAMI|nr:DNA-3-methyladenine glycosylase 1 [Phtheirospermum japonicum]
MAAGRTMMVYLIANNSIKRRHIVANACCRKPNEDVSIIHLALKRKVLDLGRGGSTTEATSFSLPGASLGVSQPHSLYAAFHDEEWGLPVHDDKKLFELLSFSTALAELTWPVILSKRPIFRDVFLDFDPMAVSKLNDKKITTQASPASSLLSELKLRSIVENARQICKIIDEHGSFDKYIWSFVNHKPIVGNFRYSRQVPIKTSKADTISKDLVRRGFRGVGPTVVYSFMQVAGITNDHLVNCFRYRDCITVSDLRDKDEGVTSKNETNPREDLEELAGDIDDLNLSR